MKLTLAWIVCGLLWGFIIYTATDLVATHHDQITELLK